MMKFIDNNQRFQPFIQLLVWTMLVAGVWCWVLPLLASEHSVSQWLKSLDEQGIDPSAMFYTELDSMDRVLDRLEGRAEDQTLNERGGDG